MRAPPAVEVTCAPGGAWRAALSLAVGASVAVPLAWGLPHVAAAGDSSRPGAFFTWLADPVVQGALALAAGLLACAAIRVAREIVIASERTLRWDGQDWVISTTASGRPDRRGDASLMLDLGPWMLVRFVPAGGDRRDAAWLPLTIAGDPARWAALRGALWNWRGNPSDGGRRS